MYVCVSVYSKHQVFENATLASLLPAGSTSKDHAPSITAEGGVKIKHTVIPRSKDSFQLDLTAESALPATAHWYVTIQLLQ